MTKMRWNYAIPVNGNATEWKEHFCLFPVFCGDFNQYVWLEWCYKRKVYNVKPRPGKYGTLIFGAWDSEYKLGDLK